MSRLISDIEPETIEDYLMKYEYSLALMNEATMAGVALQRLADWNPSFPIIKMQFDETKASFEVYISVLRQYRDKQKQALLDFVKE